MATVVSKQMHIHPLCIRVPEQMTSASVQAARVAYDSSASSSSCTDAVKWSSSVLSMQPSGSSQCASNERRFEKVSDLDWDDGGLPGVPDMAGWPEVRVPPLLYEGRFDRRQN